MLTANRFWRNAKTRDLPPWQKAVGTSAPTAMTVKSTQPTHIPHHFTALPLAAVANRIQSTLSLCKRGVGRCRRSFDRRGWLQRNVDLISQLPRCRHDLHGCRNGIGEGQRGQCGLHGCLTPLQHVRMQRESTNHHLNAAGCRAKRTAVQRHRLPGRNRGTCGSRILSRHRRNRQSRLQLDLTLIGHSAESRLNNNRCPHGSLQRDRGQHNDRPRGRPVDNLRRKCCRPDLQQDRTRLTAEKATIDRDLLPDTHFHSRGLTFGDAGGGRRDTRYRTLSGAASPGSGRTWLPANVTAAVVWPRDGSCDVPPRFALSVGPTGEKESQSGGKSQCFHWSRLSANGSGWLSHTPHLRGLRTVTAIPKKDPRFGRRRNFTTCLRVSGSDDHAVRRSASLCCPAWASRRLHEDHVERCASAAGSPAHHAQ